MTPADIGRLAHWALMEEVDATPKPGLVDRANSGAHRDMDHGTFVASAAALRPHFEGFARLGAQLCHLPEAQLLAALRGPGLAAEADMLAATGGVNTHKGAIFSIGILCAAAARQTALGRSLSPAALGRVAARMTAGLTARELDSAPARPRPTAGERMYRQYGALGARGEAESGFAAARRHGLRRLRLLLARGEERNTAYVRTLLSLMAHVTDTNVLARHDMATAQALRAQALALHRRYSPQGVADLDARLIAQNISPGGCADLLAVSIFLDSLYSSPKPAEPVPSLAAQGHRLPRDPHSM